MAEHKLRILIVDDDPLALSLLERHLQNGGHEVVRAHSGREGLQMVVREAPQMVITDWMMPEMDGLEFCRRLREFTDIGHYVFVVVLTAHTEKSRLIQALDAGADDFLSKPFHAGELLSRIRAGSRIIALEADLARKNREVHRYNAEMELLNEKLERLATTDQLTGLMNRRQALATLDETWKAAERYHQPLSCIMMDIDRFKTFNDTHGHAAGDVVLKETAAVSAAAVRGVDKACRIGGEEFLVICPNTDADGAARVAERIRARVERHSYAFEGKDLSVTVSLGVAARGDDAPTTEELIKRADDALYAAKTGGRNRVEVFTPTAAATS